MAVIEVRNLAKRYGEQVALEGVSFAVEQGEIFGILGPNGAGKTTAVESMAGLRRPDSGSIRVLGLDPQAEGRELRERVGIQLQETHLQDNIKVWEALDLYASLYPRPADWNRPTVASRLMGRMRAPVPASEPLSQRELEVLGLVAQGAGNREAAARLFISEATVKTHLMHIYAKLGVNDRAAAVAAAFDRGLLTPGER